MTRLSDKLVISSFAILFVASTAILLIASTAQVPVPTWGGYLDVAMVFLIALTGFMIYGRCKLAPTYDKCYQGAVYLFPLMTVGMWLFRSELDFNILLPGVAWRTYLFLSILPYALRLWKLDQSQ